jgi:hypothetical protein
MASRVRIRFLTYELDPTLCICDRMLYLSRSRTAGNIMKREYGRKVEAGIEILIEQGIELA